MIIAFNDKSNMAPIYNAENIKAKKNAYIKNYST